MKNTMQSITKPPRINTPRSQFNLSHGRKSTIRQGQLHVHYLAEVLPGDTFNVQTSTFMRMLTPIAPLMDNLRRDTFYFFVPNRLIWSNFKKFMGEQTNIADSTSYTVPTITSPAVTGFVNNSLADNLGLPTEIVGLTVNALPFRAYYRIIQDWFKDENIGTDLTLNTGDGPDTYADNSQHSLCLRSKRKDYFWQALPWPQKGTAASIALNSSSVDIKSAVASGNAISYYNTTSSAYQRMLSSGTEVQQTATAGSGTNKLYADLASVTAGTIEQLRYLVAIQQFMEADARGGTRYTEIVRSHFGVTSPDARLQRSEYLGGGSSAINFHPVAQTSSTDATSPQGTLASFATSSGRDGFVKSFTEHGYILGLIAVTGEYSYQQGIDRLFSKSSKYDFYWPELAHLGEQAILNKEIYADASANDSLVFGYVPRYDEYRHGISRITGNMRSNATYTYDIWHAGFKFLALPALNSTYIADSLPMDRIVAVPEDDHFLLDCWHDVKAARPLPTQVIPGGMTRF